MSKFWNFKQNNSGGIFYVNDVVASNVIIEADSIDLAKQKFESLALPMDYCECCGERWGYGCLDVGDESDKPLIFAFINGGYQDVSPDHEGLRDPERDNSAIIYYLDGSVVKNYSRTDYVPGVKR